MICNLTGVPAISMPVDYSLSTHLPISIQLMSAWWREDILLRIAYAIETNVIPKKPEVYCDVLEN